MSIDINKFNIEIDSYINNYEENSNVLTKIKERINELNKNLEKECSLVFLADKGSGKTTIIDCMTGLTLEKEKTNEKTGRKYIVEEDVLETGSGATTTFEVEITQSLGEESRLVVTPYKKDDVIDILRNFASTVFKTAHDVELSGDASIAPELFRACRNMTKLTERKGNNEEKVDHAKLLALEYDTNDYEVFEKRVIELANIDNRNTTRFVYDSIKDNEKSWIKKTFRKLNLVHIDDAPLPARITLEINKNLFNFEKLNRVNKIVDTRGLEAGSNTDRSDIKSLFRDSKNNILLFVDKFNSPSKSIIDLLNHYVYDKEMECINRIGYIVNFKDGEPERVISTDGQVDNENEGIYEKKSQVVQSFQENEVYIKKNNMIYCNPKRFLNEEGRIRVDMDEIEDYGSPAEVIAYKKGLRENDRKKLTEDIADLIKQYDQSLITEINTLYSKYEEIKEEIEKSCTINVDNICDNIKKYPLEFDLSKVATEIYSDYIDSKYPSTLRAINNRYGIYNYNDIFCEGSNFLEDVLKKELKDIKDKAIGDLSEIEKSKNLNNNQKNIVEFLIKDVNKYFFRQIEVINEHFYKRLKEEIYSKQDMSFWDKVKARWGKGSGYRNEINKYYRGNIVDKNFNIQINEEVNDLVEDFKDGLIEILANAK